MTFNLWAVPVVGRHVVSFDMKSLMRCEILRASDRRTLQQSNSKRACTPAGKNAHSK